MTDSSLDRNPLESLAEEFLDRFRRGERPALSEYTSKYPALAGEIRDLFPALVMLEDVRPASSPAEDSTPPAPRGRSSNGWATTASCARSAAAAWASFTRPSRNRSAGMSR